MGWPKGKPRGKKPIATIAASALRPIFPAHGAKGRPRREKKPEGEPRSDAHRPSEESRKMIANMAGYGFDILAIGRIAGLSSATLHKHYREELRNAAIQKDLIVAQSAFLKAIGGPEQNWEKADSAMIRWWMEIRQRWQKPPERLIAANLDLSKLTDGQLEQLERILERASGIGGDPAGEGPAE